MTPIEFDYYLITTRAKLVDAYKQNGEVTELDVYTKLTLDYQDQIFTSLFHELNNLQKNLNLVKSELLKDNRERFEIIMKKIKRGFRINRLSFKLTYAD